MQTCPHCGAAFTNGPTCPKCHPSVPEGIDEVPIATTQLNRSSWSEPQIPVDVFTSKAGVLHRSMAVKELFAFKDQLVIGRARGCDICLPHSSISRMHARLERVADGIRLHDLQSINGVLVGGRRITESATLREGERIGIGPYLFCLADGVLHALDSSQSVRLEARSLDKVITVGQGRTRKLLDNINLVIEPGEFVSLLGPSGSGKSTLMDCLNGRRPATSGQVLANGEDFYRHFDTFRQSLGYVPQKDIVHNHLTVRKALYYTARLRLPPDTTPAELQTRIGEVLKLMELDLHQDTPIGNLSGGQIKRVSLGAELLARPCVLYIDEATSGLDAGTESRMMRLFQQLSREGRSVLCITHNVDHVGLCDQLLILSAGRLVFFGPPGESLVYFQVSRVGEIYDRLSTREPATWEKEFRACSLHRTFVEDRLATAPVDSVMTPLAPALSSPSHSRTAAAPKPPRHPALHQFRVLVLRYLELLWRDPRTLRLLLLQAPLVALIVFLAFLGKPFRREILSARPLNAAEHALLADWHARLQTVQNQEQSLRSALEKLERHPGEANPVKELLAKIPIGQASVKDVTDKGDLLLRHQGPLIPEQLVVNPSYTYILAYLLVVTVLWFGCNNAAKEIVKEEAIYLRERAVNLGILPYLASKFVVLSLISALQVFLMMLTVYGGLELIQADNTPAPIYRLDYGSQFGFLVLLAMTGVALGLLLSACVSNADRAATLLPYVLIPQIILGGGILPMTSMPLSLFAYLFSPAYWAYRAIRLGETELPAAFPWRVEYNDDLRLAAAALVGQMVVLLLLTAWLLRRWDVRRS